MLVHFRASVRIRACKKCTCCRRATCYSGTCDSRCAAGCICTRHGLVCSRLPAAELAARRSSRTCACGHCWDEDGRAADPSAIGAATTARVAVECCSATAASPAAPANVPPGLKCVASLGGLFVARRRSNSRNQLADAGAALHCACKARLLRSNE
jgi:hypothetical protein